jgi:hypothetical protein
MVCYGLVGLLTEYELPKKERSQISHFLALIYSTKLGFSVGYLWFFRGFWLAFNHWNRGFTSISYWKQILYLACWLRTFFEMPGTVRNRYGQNQIELSQIFLVSVKKCVHRVFLLILSSRWVQGCYSGLELIFGMTLMLTYFLKWTVIRRKGLTVTARRHGCKVSGFRM